MKHLPIARLFASAFVVVVVSTGLGFFVCLKTGNVTAMSVVMLLSMAIGTALIFRWWIPVSRAMGIQSAKPTRAQWMIAALLFTMMAIAVVLEHFVYELTRSRLAEIVVAICVVVPAGIFIFPQSFMVARPVTASEFPLARMNYYLQFALVVIFGLNTSLQLTLRHDDPTINGLREFLIATYFAYFALAPFAIVALRRRYLQAKALKAAAPPDRWQLYKEKLARNE
jgi:hypothetical protein